MAEKKKALPEINIGDGPLVDLAAQLATIRAQKAQLETEEKTLRAAIEEHALALRDEKLDGTPAQIVGMIRVTDERAPIRVEFRVTKNAALDIGSEADLDDLFKGARPLLFGKDTIVTEITEPDVLLADIRKSGRNPWDHLKLTVKPGSDEILSQYLHVISSAAFMPKDGFLATISEIIHTLTDEAVDYLRTFIKHAVSPTVVAGSKGKA